MTIKNIRLFNKETGEEIIKSDIAHNIRVTSDEETEHKDTHSYMLPPSGITISSNGSVDEKLCSQIFNNISSDLPNPWDIIVPTIKPARIHKKKRINKKWRKKYGYRVSLRMIKGWKMRANTDGSVDFIKD